MSHLIPSIAKKRKIVCRFFYFPELRKRKKEKTAPNGAKKISTEGSKNCLISSCLNKRFV